MAETSLFLNIEQGPKAGSRVQCKPTSITIIGRARACTLQISKDAGISQKHVCFQWHDDAQHTGWMAMDMGSSNGTIINNQLAAPHEWICVQTGDLIKIGSETSIWVEIAGNSEDNNLQVAPKRKERSRKRTCAAAASHSKAIAEESASTSSKSKPRIKRNSSKPADVDPSMTVEEWFQHMMEEGPKYLHKVSEAMIQDIMHESQQFDEYVMSLG